MIRWNKQNVPFELSVNLKFNQTKNLKNLYADRMSYLNFNPERLFGFKKWNENKRGVGEYGGEGWTTYVLLKIKSELEIILQRIMYFENYIWRTKKLNQVRSGLAEDLGHWIANFLANLFFGLFASVRLDNLGIAVDTKMRYGIAVDIKMNIPQTP